jgi:hypothetical protein
MWCPPWAFHVSFSVSTYLFTSSFFAVHITTVGEKEHKFNLCVQNNRQFAIDCFFIIYAFTYKLLIADLREQRVHPGLSLAPHWGAQIYRQQLVLIGPAFFIANLPLQ